MLIMQRFVDLGKRAEQFEKLAEHRRQLLAQHLLIFLQYVPSVLPTLQHSLMQRFQFHVDIDTF